MSNKKKSLREKGIAANEVSASRFIHAPHTSLFVAPEGHLLFDNRSLDPVDEDLAKDMAERVLKGLCPNTKAILVQERKVEGRDVLLVVDGHGREQALRRAYEIVGMSGTSVLMPLVEFFSGSDKDLLLERARRNDHDRYARNDSVSTLAFRVRQGASVGISDEEFAAASPKDVTVKVVEALHRFGDLDEALRARFDAKEVPVGFLPAVVDAAPEDREALVSKLLASGAKTQRGVTRTLNKEKAKDSSARVTFTPKRAKMIATEILEGIPSKKMTPEDHRALGFAECLLSLSGEDLPELPEVVKDALARLAGKS